MPGVKGRGGSRNSPDDLKLAQEIGERLRLLRIERGYPNPLDFARTLESDPEAASVLSSNLSAIERGRHFVRIPMLLRLAAALGVPASYLLGDLSHDDVYEHGRRAALADMAELLSELRKRGTK